MGEFAANSLMIAVALIYAGLCGYSIATGNPGLAVPIAACALACGVAVARSTMRSAPPGPEGSLDEPHAP